jgi:hypothetical protein
MDPFNYYVFEMVKMKGAPGYKRISKVKNGKVEIYFLDIIVTFQIINVLVKLS